MEIVPTNKEIEILLTRIQFNLLPVKVILLQFHPNVATLGPRVYARVYA